MKKARPVGKTEVASYGKNAKVGSSFPTGGRLLSVSTGASSTLPSYRVAKNYKSSTTFGVIWVPRRKLNKYYKDTVYNSHRNDRSNERGPSMYNYMSVDSSNYQTQLKTKEDDSNLLIPEHSANKPSAAVSTGIGATVSLDLPLNTTDSAEVTSTEEISTEEKQELIKRDEKDYKEAAGDTDTNDKANNEHVSSEKGTITETDKDTLPKTEKEKLADNVDSVFLRSPPPHKTRAMASTPPEEEECGIKCLYYTLQCCDCVLM